MKCDPFAYLCVNMYEYQIFILHMYEFCDKLLVVIHLLTINYIHVCKLRYITKMTELWQVVRSHALDVECAASRCTPSQIVRRTLPIFLSAVKLKRFKTDTFGVRFRSVCWNWLKTQ
jgi:hypothetical protein